MNIKLTHVGVVTNIFKVEILMWLLVIRPTMEENDLTWHKLSCLQAG